MEERILERLREITPEERAILQGNTTIDRNLYMQGKDNRINGKKLLNAGKLITVRPHTRFIHFPEHSHDYVEMIYMCSGRTTHIVNGRKIRLEPGELLFLTQSAVHEVCKAEENDLAVNFIVLPEFFSAPMAMIGQEQTPLGKFLIGSLCGQDLGPGYLHFQVAGVKPIQNLVENLLWTLMEETPNKRKTSQMTMTLLLMQLLGHTDAITAEDQEDALIWQVLRYVESEYAQGSFSQLAKTLHYDESWLSREIKRKTGKTYTQLVQQRRLAQAAFLLKNTRKKVDEISRTVGYENISFFHRLFWGSYGKSPKEYRDEE